MEDSESALQVSWRWVCGVALLVLVSLISVCSSFVLQSVVDEGVSAFLYTYICSCLFALYIPISEFPIILKHLLGARGGERICSSGQELNFPEGGRSERLGLTNGADVETEKQAIGADFLEGQLNEEKSVLTIGKSTDAASEPPWPRRRTAAVALWIGPVWFLVMLSSNFSLKFTTVTSNTILSTTTCLFTLLISITFLKEKLTRGKLTGVILCMSGSVVVALGDSHGGLKSKSDSRPVLGDSLVLISSMLGALYTAIARAKIPDEDESKGKCRIALVFGYVGLFNALIFGPVALLLHFTDIEPFRGLTRTQLCVILANGLIGTMLNEYLWARAMLLTSPTVAVAGLTLQVPIAAVVDSIRGRVPSPVNVAGAVAVLIGFFGINRSPVSGNAGLGSRPKSEIVEGSGGLSVA